MKLTEQSRMLSTPPDGPSANAQPGVLPPEVVRAVWWQARSFRERLHRQVWGNACDTVLVTEGTTLTVAGTCVCRDFVVDVLAEVARFLTHADGLYNPAGAARVHVRTRAEGDWIRRMRTERGAQARTDRVRSGECGRRLPDDYHRAILEYLADEAGSLAPLEDDEQLLRRLSDRASAEFGGLPDDHRSAIAASLPVVEQACRCGRRTRVDGILVSWWERYVDGPLGRRYRRTDAPFGSEEARFDVVCDPAGPTVEAVLDRLEHGLGGTEAAIVEALKGVPIGAEAQRWVVSTIARLADEGLLPVAVARDFGAAPDRVRAAVTALVDLAA